MILRYNIDKDGYLVKNYLEELGLPDQLFKDIRGGNGQFLVNDQAVDNHYKLKKGDFLEVVLPVSSQGENIVSTYKDFEIVYEDSYMLIINKEANVATIPTREYFSDSLANYVMSYYKRNGILANIHFVSRLDAPTSGLIMLAKNGYITYLLQNTLIDKRYLLEVDGIIDKKEGIIQTGIEKDETSIIKRKVTFDYINSKTVYNEVYVDNNKSTIEALLITGKTHQLRLHFSYLGYPIIGDELYGKATNDGILHLHSYHLEFDHPVTKEHLVFERYPSWFKKKLAK